MWSSHWWNPMHMNTEKNKLDTGMSWPDHHSGERWSGQRSRYTQVALSSAYNVTVASQMKFQRFYIPWPPIMLGWEDNKDADKQNQQGTQNKRLYILINYVCASRAQQPPFRFSDGSQVLRTGGGVKQYSILALGCHPCAVLWCIAQRVWYQMKLPNKRPRKGEEEPDSMSRYKGRNASPHPTRSTAHKLSIDTGYCVS